MVDRVGGVVLISKHACPTGCLPFACFFTERMVDRPPHGDHASAIHAVQRWGRDRWVWGCGERRCSDGEDGIVQAGDKGCPNRVILGVSDPIARQTR